MKIKLKFIFIFISIVIIYGIKPLSVSAADGYSQLISASSYGYNISNTQRVIIGTCYNTYNINQINKGMMPCVNDQYPISSYFSYSSEDVGNGRIKYTSYFTGRVDSWGKNGNNGYTTWNKTPEVGNAIIYPGMRLVYRRYETLASFVGEEMIDEILYSYNTGQLKLDGRSIWNLPNDTNGNFMPVSVAPPNFAIENVALENVNGTWYVAFDIRIEKLQAGWNSEISDGNLLGIPGITSGHGGNVRAYHYFLPIAIEIEYQNNKCLGNTAAAKTYAEANPGTCCYEYPETCPSVNDRNPCVDGTNTQTAEEYANSNLGMCCYEYPETCCRTGMGDQSPYEYAMARPGVCCEEIPESCCNVTTQSNGEPWIGSSNDDGIWVTYYKDKWQGNICCSDTTFVYNNPGKCPSKNYFYKTEDKTCGNNTNAEYLYTTSYVQLDNDGNFVNASGIKCDLDTGNCNSPFTYSYTISIDKKNRNYDLNQVGYSYFDNTSIDDYNKYLDRWDNKNISLAGNTNGTAIEPPSNYRANSLADNNFNYKVENLRKDPNDSSKFLVDITVTIYNIGKYWTDTPRAYDYNGSKVFFVPIKIELCWYKSGGGGGKNPEPPGGDTCTNLEYADEHPDECCNESGSDYGKNNYLTCCNKSENFYRNNKNTCDGDTDDGGSDDNDESNGYMLDSNTSCENGTKVTSDFTKEESGITIEESINLDTAKSPKVNSGTGFEFNLGITNTVVYEMDNSTIYSSYSSLETAHNQFTSAINSNKDLYNDGNLYNNQEIYFNNGNKKLNSPYIISYKSSNGYKEIENDTKEFKYKDSNYTCKQTTCGYFATTCYKWYNESDERVNPPENDENGGQLSNGCSESNVGSKAIYKKSMDAIIKYEYYLSAKLPNSYISKLYKNDSDEENVVYSITSDNEKNYISGGNKFYTKITDPTGYYPFYITIQNGGVTKKIKTVINDEDNPAYSCSYLVTNCALDGVCLPDTEPDPDIDDIKPSLGTSNYYFRPISLTTPFPNEREAGPNWFSYKNGNSYTYITIDEDGDEKGESVYTKEPMYEITITNQMASDIRKFNKNNPDYSSSKTMVTIDNGGTKLCNGLCRQSLFLNYLEGSYNGDSLGLSSISRGDGLKIRSDFANIRYKRNGAIETIYGGDN